MDELWKPLVAFIVIGLPVILIFGHPFIRRWFDLRERKMELEAQMTAEKAAQYAAHTERLEQRVRVLERIVTDKGIVVADEIERLRDKPLN
jgi:hypothetical protein